MSGTRTKVVAATLLCSVTLTGCKTLEDKISSMDACDWAGTGIGAVAGGIAGGVFLGGGDGRILGAVAGAAIGGFIGNQIAAMLDCHDKKAAASAATIAADAPEGEAVVWASQGAKVDSSKVPVTAKPAAAVAAPVTTTSKVTTKQAKVTKTGKTSTAALEVPPPPPPPPADPRAAQSQEAAKLAMASRATPVSSEGKSGAWGVARPVGPMTRTADGRMCRQIENVVYDAQGQSTTAVTTSCLDAENKWNVAWIWGYEPRRA